jgi:cytochrome c biogenesis protein CcdA
MGLAHIIFSGNPNSTLFHTPNFLKSLITTHSKKSNYAFDFILGIAFALIKTPCLVGPYLVILNWLALNTVLASFYILIFNIGIILPLFSIAVLLSAGIVNISTIDRFRIQGRNTIRLLTGILLVSTAILLLIF